LNSDQVIGGEGAFGKGVALAGYTIGEFNFQAKEGGVTIGKRITGIDLAFESLWSQFWKRVRYNACFILAFKQFPGHDGWSWFDLADKGKLHGGMGTCISLDALEWKGCHEESKQNNGHDYVKSGCFHHTS
jgi:hypothetical protein